MPTMMVQAGPRRYMEVSDSNDRSTAIVICRESIAIVLDTVAASRKCTAILCKEPGIPVIT